VTNDGGAKIGLPIDVLRLLDVIGIVEVSTMNAQCL